MKTEKTQREAFLFRSYVIVILLICVHDFNLGGLALTFLTFNDCQEIHLVSSKYVRLIRAWHFNHMFGHIL